MCRVCVGKDTSAADARARQPKAAATRPLARNPGRRPLLCDNCSTFPPRTARHLTLWCVPLPPEMEPNRDEMVATFTSITGSDFAFAISFLEANAWNLDAA
eukprot:5628427-Prymnesium_polylepis.1